MFQFHTYFVIIDMLSGGSMLDNTSLFDQRKIESALVSKTFFEVFEALEESGYNPVNQITGYLITDDPMFITNYKKARDKIAKIEKVKLISLLVENYFIK